MPILASVCNPVTSLFSTNAVVQSPFPRVDPDLPAALDAALVLDQLDRDMEAMIERNEGEQEQLEPELRDIGGEDGW